MNIVNTMLWVKKQAYEDTTIKATAKRLKDLQKNCLLADSESVKLFVANKKCSNGFSARKSSKYDESIYVERWLNILKELQAKISPTQTASYIQNQKSTV